MISPCSTSHAAHTARVDRVARHPGVFPPRPTAAAATPTVGADPAVPKGRGDDCEPAPGVVRARDHSRRRRSARQLPVPRVHGLYQRHRHTPWQSIGPNGPCPGRPPARSCRRRSRQVSHVPRCRNPAQDRVHRSPRAELCAGHHCHPDRSSSRHRPHQRPATDTLLTTAGLARVLPAGADQDQLLAAVTVAVGPSRQ